MGAEPGRLRHLRHAGRHRSRLDVLRAGTRSRDKNFTTPKPIGTHPTGNAEAATAATLSFQHPECHFSADAPKRLRSTRHAVATERPAAPFTRQCRGARSDAEERSGICAQLFAHRAGALPGPVDG